MGNDWAVAFQGDSENRMIGGMASLCVHFLPALTTAEKLAGGVVVVIDVLRASTTIATALAAGAREIIPCLEVDDAKRKAAELRNQSVLLGGERHGKPIPGFNLGSSPREYTSQTVGDRMVVFTSTNGTRAMQLCTAAQTVFVGAFVTLSATVRRIAGGAAIHLLCAGTEGEITREDVLFAGAVVDGVCASTEAKIDINDQARIARGTWRHMMGELDVHDPAAIERLAKNLRHTQGGHNLIALGMEQDIADAAQIDRYDFVPVLEVKQWRILKA